MINKIIKSDLSIIKAYEFSKEGYKAILMNLLILNIIISGISGLSRTLIDPTMNIIIVIVILVFNIVKEMYLFSSLKEEEFKLLDNMKRIVIVSRNILILALLISLVIISLVIGGIAMVGILRIFTGDIIVMRVLLLLMLATTPMFIVIFNYAFYEMIYKEEGMIKSIKNAIKISKGKKLKIIGYMIIGGIPLTIIGVLTRAGSILDIITIILAITIIDRVEVMVRVQYINYEGNTEFS